MNARTFVDVLQQVVGNAAVEDTIGELVAPLGRRPSDRMLQLSGWYRSLSDTDRAMLSEILGMVSHSAMFGFLCVLDGVRAIESRPDKGTLSLTFWRDGSSTLLNDPAAEFLHDILNEV